MKPTVEMGPRLARVFADIGEKIDSTPDDALREVTDLLRYVDGQSLLNKLVGYMVSCVPLPEPEPAPSEDEDEDGPHPTQTELVTLDLERDEDDEPEFAPEDDDSGELEIPRDPPPTAKQVKQDGRVKSRSSKPKPKPAG